MIPKEYFKCKTFSDYIEQRRLGLEELSKKVKETELTDKELHKDLEIREKAAVIELNCLLHLRVDLLEESLSKIDEFKKAIINDKEIDLKKINVLYRDLLLILG